MDGRDAVTFGNTSRSTSSSSGTSGIAAGKRDAFNLLGFFNKISPLRQFVRVSQMRSQETLHLFPSTTSPITYAHYSTQPGPVNSATLNAAAKTIKLQRRGRLIRFFGVSSLLVGGLSYLGYLFTPDWRQLTDSKHYYSDWKIRSYFSLPWNAISRTAGSLANKEIPEGLRATLFGAFARAYDCRMEEALNPDFKGYTTFAEFFNRSLRPETRPISASPLVSPADGIVLHFGRVEDGRVEYVKGHDYDIQQFVGDVKLNNAEELDLYQVVIYLAPGNYHSFHSPARWVAEEARHYPGLLLSVRPSLLNRVPHLFCLNERVVLNGEWKHGFFSMSAVAATNVGDIAIDAKPELQTNVRVRRRYAKYEPVAEQIHHPFLPGEKVGEFRLGSTIVLVFQAPPTLRFAIQAGDSLRYGQSLITGGC
ncbi:unnamed protein product, partial [Mesorhabditis belari]|uniref:Phosphatidylserine decarboxylase proenzyme, mitochondrial n=1 Tax=Mesorhabditis belari TaxID=2138241 RepID=A0AAF3JBG1_9BILA